MEPGAPYFCVALIEVPHQLLLLFFFFKTSVLLSFFFFWKDVRCRGLGSGVRARARKVAKKKKKREEVSEIQVRVCAHTHPLSLRACARQILAASQQKMYSTVGKPRLAPVFISASVSCHDEVRKKSFFFRRHTICPLGPSCPARTTGSGTTP